KNRRDSSAALPYICCKAMGVKRKGNGGVVNSSVYRNRQANLAGDRSGMTRRDLMAATALGIVAGGPAIARAAAPQGQLTYGIHVSLAPTWFDPAETQGIITPFMVLYALHDAMVKPMPGELQSPSLAESWSAAEDGLTHDFVIRKNAKFHDGAPVT